MTVEEVIEAMAACLERGDIGGACDVIDSMFLAEYPNEDVSPVEFLKLKRDIRGLMVAAWRHGFSFQVAKRLILRTKGSLP